MPPETGSANAILTAPSARPVNSSDHVSFDGREAKSICPSSPPPIPPDAAAKSRSDAPERSSPERAADASPKPTALPAPSTRRAPATRAPCGCVTSARMKGERGDSAATNSPMMSAGVWPPPNSRACSAPTLS